MTYKEAAQRLRISLQALKRYGREFLEEDPSCGYQCGMARLISVEEAWILFVVNRLYKIGYRHRNKKALLKEIPGSGIWKLAFSFPGVEVIIDVDVWRTEFHKALNINP